MKNIINILAVLVILMNPIIISPSIVFADNKTEVCNGIKIAGGDDCDTPDQSEEKVNNVIKAVVDTFSAVIGIVAVIMIMIAGFKYITASGDTNNITSAKSTITYALVGLIIVALAQVIVRFVINKV